MATSQPAIRIAQRWVHDMDFWATLSLREEENTLGRAKQGLDATTDYSTTASGASCFAPSLEALEAALA